MKFNYGLAVFCFILLAKFSNARIVLVQVLARYTESTPVSTHTIRSFFPKIREDNVYLPEGYNHLTTAGKNKALNIASILQQRYGYVFKNSSIHLQPIISANAIQTTDLMVLGLTTDCYSWDKNCLDSKNNINSKLLPSIQFNQIHYDLKNKDHDQLFLSTVFCKNYQDKFNLLIDEQTQKMSEELRKIYHYLSEHTGTNFHTNVDAWILHQYLEAKANSGGPLEPWMQDLLANGILTNLTIENFQTKSATPQMRRLLGGNFINKFLQNIDDYLHGAKTRLFMYVGDDYHIAGLLSALRLYDGKHIPNYGSYIALEVHEFYGKLSIVVKYNNGRSDPSQTELLSLPGYNLPFCPLSNFKTIVEENTLKNFPGECSN